MAPDSEQGARNPVKGRETQPLFAVPEASTDGFTGSKASPLVDDSENEEAPNSGYVIHVASEPGKGKKVSPIRLCCSSSSPSMGQILCVCWATERLGTIVEEPKVA